MPEPLKLDKGISFEFEKEAVFEKDGKRYTFTSFKKISEYKDKAGKEQRKYQNLTVKPEHLMEFIPWLEECLEELKSDASAGDDVPF